MFDLEDLEKRILIFLLVALLIGVGIIVYKKLCPTGDLTIKYSGGSSISSGKNVLTSDKKVNINKAPVDQLMGLKGVGKVLAERIVDHRRKKGLFISLEDIKKVPGIGEKLFTKIRDSISLE